MCRFSVHLCFWVVCDRVLFLVGAQCWWWSWLVYGGGSCGSGLFGFWIVFLFWALIQSLLLGFDPNSYFGLLPFFFGRNFAVYYTVYRY